jgi:hypothetical protein
MAVKKMTEWLAKWEPSALPPASQDNNYVAIEAPSDHTHTNEHLRNANAQPQESTLQLTTTLKVHSQVDNRSAENAQSPNLGRKNRNRLVAESIKNHILTP